MSNITLPIFKVPVWVYQFLPTLHGRPAQGSRGGDFLVEAENKIKARLILTKEPGFWRNYNKLSREERVKLTKKGVTLFRLRREGKIEKILDCGLRHKNKRGEYTCGRPVYSIKDNPLKEDDSMNMNGEHGMCCIEGYDLPFELGCPYGNKDSD